MKRIIICGIILALCLTGSALADASFWTRNDDLYFHGAENCGGEEGRVPISEEAALAFNKYLCPVCCSRPDNGGDVDAVARGGTIVVRFSDSWLSSHELTSVFGWSSASNYSGAQAMRMLGEYLHDEKYASFMEEYLKSGFAEGRADTPHILAANGALVMSKRHINNYWYLIVRPKEDFKNNWDMYWRVSSLKLRMEKDVLSVDFDLQTVEETRSLALQNMNDGEPVYKRAGDSIEMFVYRTLDGNVAVIRENNPGDRLLENVLLHIDGAPSAIELTGYAEEKAAVYCCMLTDGELGLLKKNAKAEIRHLEAVNSRVYRVAEEQRYSYYSRDNDELLFSFDRVNGQDPANHSFVLVLDGEPGRFVGFDGDGSSIYDYNGRRYFSAQHKSLTPLVWNGDGGVFLAESREDSKSAAKDMLSANGIELGERYEIDIQKEWGDYRCWLVDENGENITDHSNNQGFAVYEDGRIVLIDWEGMEYLAYDPNTND